MPGDLSFPAELHHFMLQASEKRTPVDFPTKEEADRMRMRIYAVRRKMKKQNSIHFEVWDKVCLRVLPQPDPEKKDSMPWILEMAPHYQDLLDAFHRSGLSTPDSMRETGDESGSSEPVQPQPLPPLPPAAEADVPDFDDAMKNFMEGGDSSGS